jgi:hypothetical protein
VCTFKLINSDIRISNYIQMDDDDDHEQDQDDDKNEDENTNGSYSKKKHFGKLDKDLKGWVYLKASYRFKSNFWKVNEG